MKPIKGKPSEKDLSSSCLPAAEGGSSFQTGAGISSSAFPTSLLLLFRVFWTKSSTFLNFGLLSFFFVKFSSWNHYVLDPIDNQYELSTSTLRGVLFGGFLILKNHQKTLLGGLVYSVSSFQWDRSSPGGPRAPTRRAPVTGGAAGGDESHETPLGAASFFLF